MLCDFSLRVPAYTMVLVSYVLMYVIVMYAVFISYLNFALCLE